MAEDKDNEISRREFREGRGRSDGFGHGSAGFRNGNGTRSGNEAEGAGRHAAVSV